jgi:hypothetical protein
MKGEIVMKSLSAMAMRLLLVTGLALLGCSSQMSGQGDAGWITLLDGSNPKTLDNWNRIGDANWRAEDGAIVADKGKGGHLVSKNSYKDFQIRAEFWADHTAKGSHLTVVLNGTKTAEIQHTQFTEGPISLQFSNREKGTPGGAIKWRKVQIRPL